MSDLGPTTATRQRTLNFRLRLILSCSFNVARPTDGFPNFKTPVETSTSPKSQYVVRKRSVIICFILQNVKAMIKCIARGE